MGWLPSAPQLGANPLDLTRQAEAAGKDPIAYAVERLKTGRWKCLQRPGQPAKLPAQSVCLALEYSGQLGQGP